MRLGDDGGYREYREYERLCRESQGFDVNSAGRRLCGGIIQFDLTEKEDRQGVIRATKFAIQDYNQKNNSDLQFVRLVKVNGQGVSGYLYYVTFKACSLSTRQIKVYQTIVSNTHDVLLFREKPNVAQTSTSTSTSTPNAAVTRTSTTNAVANSTSSKPISRTLAGAFLCFRNDVGKILRSLHWKKCPRSHITSLASRVWRSMSTEAKLTYRNKRSFKYEDIIPFVSVDMQIMSKRAG